MDSGEINSAAMLVLVKRRGDVKNSKSVDTILHPAMYVWDRVTNEDSWEEDKCE